MLLFNIFIIICDIILLPLTIINCTKAIAGSKEYDLYIGHEKTKRLESAFLVKKKYRFKWIVGSRMRCPHGRGQMNEVNRV